MLTGFVAGGVALQWGAHVGYCLVTFSLLFLAATLSRLMSSLFLASQSEPLPPGPELMLPDLRRLFHALMEDDTGRLFLYLLGAQAAVQISGPYFNPYMLDCLKLPYYQYVALICAAYCAKMLCLPAFGKLVARWGATRLLWCGGVAIIPTSALWLVSSSFSYLLVAQVVSGVSWAAYELAMFLLAFETIPDHRRMAVMTAFNLANATAILVGSLLGGALLVFWGITREAYLALFLISSIARVFAILLLLRAPGISIRERWTAMHARLRLAAAPRPRTALAGPHWQARRVVVVHSPPEGKTDVEKDAAPLADMAR
jgi:MFS family permease